MPTTSETNASLAEKVPPAGLGDDVGEIGRPWRLCIRTGAVALIVATVLPSSFGKTMLLYMHTLTMYALGMAPPRVQLESARNMLFLFSACSWTIVFTGWMGLWISRQTGGLSIRPPQALVSFARRLFSITWLLPCLFAVLYALRGRGFELRYVLVAVAVYGWVGRRLRMLALRNAGTPFIVFWFLSLPIVASLFGWCCIGSVFLYSGPREVFSHIILCGGCGALLMLVGLVGWWQAWRECERLHSQASTQTSTTTP